MTATVGVTLARAQATSAAASSTDWRTVARIRAGSVPKKPSPLLWPGMRRRRWKGRSMRMVWAPRARRLRATRASRSGMGTA